MIPISELNELEDEVINLYKELHRIPELGLNEVKTAALIANKLKEWNIETITGVARTGVIGTVYGVHAGKNHSSSGRHGCSSYYREYRAPLLLRTSR